MVLRPLSRLAKVDIFTESEVFGRDFDRFFLESLSLGLFYHSTFVSSRFDNNNGGVTAANGTTSGRTGV